jgi:hypothetical protein
LETESEKEYSRIRKYIFYTPKFTVNSENPIYKYIINLTDLEEELDSTNNGYKSYEILATKVEARDERCGMGDFNDNLYLSIDNEVKIYGANELGIGIKGYSVKFEFPYENWYTLGEGETGTITTDDSGVVRSPSETIFPDKYFRVIFFVSLK